jgi:hypothetical protein
MGITQDKRKFKTTKEQKNPTNPTGNEKIVNKRVDLDRETIKESQTKE